MSEDEEKKALKLDLKDIPINGEIKIKLNTGAPVKTGVGKWGDWHLWFGEVANLPKAYDGRGAEQKLVENYTGEVLFFPPKKLNENLVKAANGKVDVEVSIKKTVEEGPKGLIKRYEVKKLTEGRDAPPSTSDLTEGEALLLNDINEMISQGYRKDVTENVFVQASREEKYGGKITEERAKQLYKYI